MTTTLWRTAKDCRRRAEDAIEAAILCLDGRFSVGPSDSADWLRERSIEIVRGKGAPATRIIGLKGRWRLSSYHSLWLREQATRYVKSASTLRKKAARRHRALRRLRKERRRGPSTAPD